MLLLHTAGDPAVAAALSPLDGSGPESAPCIQACWRSSDSLMRLWGSGTRVRLSRSRAVVVVRVCVRVSSVYVCMYRVKYIIIITLSTW